MSDIYLPKRVLITVMTYPHPSRGYNECVCTAGITETHDWVRLYPINYRYRPKHQQFRKFQWIRLGLKQRGNRGDNRKESRKPDLDSIVIEGPPIGTENKWAARRAIIDNLPHSTLNELKLAYDYDQTSLGVIRPSQVRELRIERTDGNWKPEWQALFAQLPLFGPQQKPLRKIPFKFSYIFDCADSVRPHSAMIEDWELGVLFLKEAERLGSDDEAAESVRNRFYNEICRSDRDTRFFMGTIFPYNTWVVIGTFWPPRLSNESAEVIQPQLPF